MNRPGGTPWALLVGAPLFMLTAGGAVGWFTVDSNGDSNGNGDRPALDTTVDGVLAGSSDAITPSRPLPSAGNPAVIDPASIIGLDTTSATWTPGGTVLDLPRSTGELATIVDATTLEPLPLPDAPTPLIGATALDATPTDSLLTLDPSVETVQPPRDLVPEVTVPVGIDPDFVDQCATHPTPCAGALGVVRAQADNQSAMALATLLVSVPVAGAAGLSDLCNEVEGGGVPDPVLSPATRPTVAVLVNQPSTLALSGTWGDGRPLAKTTMFTLPAHDVEWRRAWNDEGLQRNIVACVTLPLDDVRAHASGGVAQLRAEVLAISATGRADISGQVTLDIPTDGDDAPFVERPTIANRGEQRLANGVLYPTVHVHYAILADEVAPAGFGLDPTTVRVFGAHAIVEGADCSGWAENEQGRDRSVGGAFRIATELRTVSGHQRPVTVVDGDMYLDPTLAGGWAGQFCIRLSAIDDTAPKAETVALRGVSVRSPRTATYSVGVLLDDSDFPGDWQLQTDWAAADGAAICNPATLANGVGNSRGAVCSTLARLTPDGIVVTMRAIDPAGQSLPILSLRVPVNTAYCNPDDPYQFLGDGCDTGFIQTIAVPRARGSDGAATVRVVLQVKRSAAAGALWLDPSHAWKIGQITSFAF